MAGRIRTIKPELLEDEKACDLSDTAWRLWVSSWLIADDHGRFRASARGLAASVWQDTGRAEEVEEALFELRENGFLRLYEVAGERYGEIKQSGWKRHQKIDHPGNPRVPVPNESDFLQSVSRNDSERLDDHHQPSPSRARALSPTTTTDHDQRSPTTDQPEVAEPDGSTGSVETDSIKTVWDAYLAGWAVNRGKGRPPVLTSERRRKIKTRLKTYSAEDLAHAFTALWASSFHVEKGFTDPEQVIRADSRVDTFLQRASAPGANRNESGSDGDDPEWAPLPPLERSFPKHPLLLREEERARAAAAGSETK